MIAFFVGLGVYLILSVWIYLSFLFIGKGALVFKMPQSAAVYYILSFTWGLPMTFLGCILALILLICGKKPKKYGRNICFCLPVNFGLSLGIFIIAPENPTEDLLAHEHGHGIQNALLGIFMPTVVALPSFIRFWYREIKERITRRPPRRKYDDIWFENSATATGKRYFCLPSANARKNTPKNKT